MDQRIRRRLQHAEVAPPTFVWEGVSETLQRRRRRRLALWWLLGMFLISVSSIGLWLWPATMTTEEAFLPTIEEPATDHPSSPAMGLISSGASPSVPSLTSPSKTAQQVIPTPPILVSSARERQVDMPTVSSWEQAEITAGKEEQDASTYQHPVSSALLASEALHFLPVKPIALSSPGLSAPPLQPAASEPAGKPRSTTRKCYSFSDKGKVWLLDAYAGPAWSLPKWNVRDAELDTYVTQRRRTETPEGAFNAGIRLSYFLHPHIVVRTGLHYDQWTERFEYTNPDFIRYHVTITQKLINGQWVSVVDTVGVEYGAEYIKTYNRFGLLDIPLQIGAEWRSGVVGISLNAGFSANVLFHKRGTILDTDGNPLSFTPGSEGREVYSPRVGLSANGTMQWFYHVAPRTRLFAEPYFRWVLRPITAASYPIEQRQHLVGLRLGVSQILDSK